MVESTMVMAALILVLVIGGGAALLAQRISPRLPRLVAIVVVIFDLLLFVSQVDWAALSLAVNAESTPTWLIYLRWDWIPAFGIHFELGLDGLSLLMVLLTLVLGAVAVSSSWTDIHEKQGFFEANLLWTLAGVVGVFLALDLFLFFLFWEVMLIPMYFLIAIWGHENRGYAAMKFFIFTQASGLLMLIAILSLAYFHQQHTGVWSFSYTDLLHSEFSATVSTWLMLGFFVAFVVKLPAFPFHTWLPDAHTQAPTAGSVILAGILLKTGAYGLIRFAVPLFPAASETFAPVALGLGAAGVLYGALLAFGQNDFKRLVAYSSVSHMGFVLLGVYAFNALAMQGAVMQMIAHGFSTAALFMIAGSLQERLNTRDMNYMGGLWRQLPRMGAVTMFFVLASLGLPGLGNFVAEFLVLLGLFQVDRWLTVIAALGLITAAAYSLLLMQRSFHGEPGEFHSLVDFRTREMLTMTVMMVALVWLGIYPQPVLDIAGPVLSRLLDAGGYELATLGGAL